MDSRAGRLKVLDITKPSEDAGQRPRAPALAKRVKDLRTRAGLTLKELSARSAISISALSKLENAQLSPTYENIVRLARGLDVDITVLFSDDVPTAVTGRRTITRKGDGVRCDTANYDYEMLCTDLAQKRMVPLLATVKAKDAKSFGSFIAHEGEEVIYVLSGKIVLHTEYYAPTLLKAGDCAYFDSRMKHGCIAQGIEDAVVFWVCSSSSVNELVLSARNGARAERPAKLAAAKGRKLSRRQRPARGKR
jgi:transcriptional regulator with XRE-family HTH domain